jgi:hypothetical protein
MFPMTPDTRLSPVLPVMLMIEARGLRYYQSQIKKSQGTSRSTSHAYLLSITVFCSPHEPLVALVPRDS